MNPKSSTIRSAAVTTVLVFALVASVAVGNAIAVQESTESAGDVSIDANGDGVVEVTNSSSATISGMSSLESGTNVTVVIQFDNNQLIQSKSVTVGENGDWETTYDLSGIDTGAEFEVGVRHDSQEVAHAEGVVVETKSGSESAMPGFGAMAALVAFVATAFVARRRA